MKFLALADTHLGYQYGRTAVARKAITELFFKQFRYAIDQAIKEKVDYVIHAGDVFNRSKPPKLAQHQLNSQIERLINHDVGFLIIPGNHDKGYLKPNLLEFFSNKYIQFNKLMQVNLGELDIIGFPFQYQNLTYVWSKVRNLANNNRKPTIIFCHQLFDGAMFGPHEMVFKNREDALSPLNFPNRSQIISGHIHRSQQLFNGRVIYTGSTARTSFVEIIEPKGFIILDTGSDYFKASFHEIPTLSMFVTEIQINDDNFSNLNEFLPNDCSRKLLRIIRTKLTPEIINKLYSKFGASDWPYLSISPREPKYLTPLYSSYQGSFHFETMIRSF